MATKRSLGLVFVAATLAPSAALTAAPAPPGALPLQLVADLPLPGAATRFDYQSVDAAHRRLYLTHLGDNSLVAFDLEAQQVLGEVHGLPSVHGVVAAPDQHRLFATVTGERTLAIIDDRTLHVESRVPAGAYPNGLAYDPRSNRVFISNNTGLGVAVVDAKNASSLPSINIGGGAGNTQYDSATGHVLAAVHGSPALVEIDPAALRVIGRISLHQVSTCHGLVLAQELRLAFAACRGAAPLLVVVDLDRSKQTMVRALPPDVDVLAFDPGLGRLYAASETGTVAVFAVARDRSVDEMGRGFVGPDAHSVAVDPLTHRVYFPLQNVAGHPVLRVMGASVPAASE